MGTGHVIRGELVPRTVAHASEQTTTVVIPLSSNAAPALHRGDRIVVWAFTSTCSVAELISDVAVQSVASDEHAIADSGQQRVVVQLADDTAATVVKALSEEGVVLRAGIVTGARRTATPAAWSCQAGAK